MIDNEECIGIDEMIEQLNQLEIFTDFLISKDNKKLKKSIRKIIKKLESDDSYTILDKKYIEMEDT